MDNITTIAELSHEFGGPEYVLGGGGNTSVKDETTLWVKPSGVTLLDIRPEDFVALDRAGLAKLFAIEPPVDPEAREARVKEMVMAARRSGAERRPSVEAPLHNVFPQRYVVHTHPALVNGLACAIHGAEACSRLFPEALWLPYCDPGFTLSREARRAIGDYTERWGVAPGVLIIENHGVFVAGESAEDIRAAYRQLIETLRAEYRAAGLECDLPPTPPPDRETDERMRQRLRTILSADEVSHVASSGPFPPPRGPLTPDHVVYARAFVHVGPISARSVAAFRRQHGYGPRVFFDPAGVWAVGATEKEAQMALAFARDGARVQYLAAAFGGPKYLGDRSRAFIEGWEVEHYRRQVSLGAG